MTLDWGEMENRTTEAASSGQRPLREPPRTVAVRELVRRRLEKDDPWDLALVQRSEVWDQVRMRHLLDSLLAGYPIGALLLCRVAEGSRVLHGVERRVIETDAQAWQLLDGQQRTNAFFSMFTAEGRYGRFFLNMSVPRPQVGPISRRSIKHGALSYIAWHDPDSDEPVPQPRAFHIDLSRWYDWAEAHYPDGPPTPTVETVAAILHSIDPEFIADLDDESASVAVDRLKKLWQVWTEQLIPVLRTSVESPLDVLEVYTRINLGGVQVTGTDVYLAAVKTFWPNAEENLDRVAESTEFLDRMGALRLVSRLASRSLQQGDLLPLKVDRLAGVRGQQLIEVMGQLTARGSPFIQRATMFSGTLIARSRLGYGLRLVSGFLWDEVFTWAVSFADADDAWYVENLELIDTYLLGASLFRYSQVLGDRYRRGALLESATAGIDGGSFPLERILSVTRGSDAGLRGPGGTFIRSLEDEEGRQWLKDWNAGLLLSFAQRLPYQISQNGEERRIDWDHIFPQAQAHRMWTLSDHGNRRHHPFRRDINSTGNLWALDASTNRALGDTPPTKKFHLLRRWQQEGGYPVWARDQWALTDEEIQGFEKVDGLLTNDPDSIDHAMKRFRALVTARASWLLDHALESFPGVELFSADAPVDSSDQSLASLDRLAHALGLSIPQTSSGSQTPTTLPSPWSDRDDEIEWVIKEATRHHTRRTKPTWRALPYGPGNGFDGRRWVPLHGPVPYILVGIVSRFAREKTGPVWVQIPNTSEGFDRAGERISESEYADELRNDEGHIWLPLPLTPELEWTPLAEELFERILEIRRIIESPPDADS